jgi:cytochrome c553
MRKSKFMLSSWFMAVAIIISGSASAGPNIANGKTIFTQGKGDAVQPCQTCHGENAQGNDDMGTPRLANIGYGYIVKQLTDFSQDKRTPSGLGAVMNGFAKGLSAQDRSDVAAYVNSLKTTPEISDLKALKESGHQIGADDYKGMELVTNGRLDPANMVDGRPDPTKTGQNDIPACSSCHQYNGAGVDPIFPKIGEQKFVYLVNQLHNWRANDSDIQNGAYARTNDPEINKVGAMRAVAKKLSDEDILNVATYLSHAPPSKDEGDTVPDNKSLLEAVTK